MTFYGARDDLLVIDNPRPRAVFTLRQVAEIVAEFAAGAVLGAVVVAWWLS